MSALEKSENKKERRRAVRLKPEARELLAEAIQKAVGNDRPGARVTRDQRAEFLGLSVVTCNRLLKGEGVDRQSLRIAFERAGLPWNDSYCEHVKPSPSETSDNEHALNRKPVRRQFLMLAMAALTLSTCLVLYLSSPLNARVSAVSSTTQRWTDRFTRLLDSAGKRFHASDFDVAREQASQAIVLARENQNASYLASGLRVIGDLEAAAGSYGQAKKYYEEALRLRQALLDRKSEPAILEAMGSVEIRLREFGQARIHLRESLRGYERDGDKTGTCMARRALGELEEHLGKRAQARQFYKYAMNDIRGANHPDIETDLQARLAVLDGADGAFDSSLQRLSICLRYWEERRHSRWIATTLRQLGYVKALAGDHAGAIDDLDASRRLFRKVGDRGGILECETLVRRLGSPYGTSRENKLAPAS